MKHRLPQLPGQMSIIQAFMPRGEPGELNINANGQSVQGGCSSSTVSPSKNDESNRSKHLKSDFNSSQNTESREALRSTDDSNRSATSLQQKAIPCLSDVAFGPLADLKVVSAPTAAVCESPPFFDTGTLYFTRIFSLPDSQKLEALTSRFQPSKGWKEPLRDFGKRCRRVPDFVFDESLYPFFRYSPSHD